MKEERFLADMRIVNRRHRLQCQCLGQIDLLAVVFFQARNIPDRLPGVSGILGEVSAPAIVGGTPRCVASDVDIETELKGVFAGGSLGPQMRLAGMNRLVAPLLQQ